MPNSSHFIKATEVVKTLKTKPDNDTLSNLYGLYKQATVGDNTNPKPGMLDMVGCTKWNSWNKVKGLTIYEAECQYITLVNTLLKK